MNRHVAAVALIAAGLLAGCTSDQVNKAQTAAQDACAADQVAQPAAAAVMAVAGDKAAAVGAFDGQVVHPAVSAACANLKAAPAR